MKIQYIAVLFIVIIIPVVVASTMFINAQMETIKLQNDYNSRLSNATYDAVQAFKINTVNNQYSSISDSKIRDIEASINTFYNNLTSSGKFSREDLDAYVPALVYTLYDGYYIYSKYDNVIPDKDGISSLNMEFNTKEDELKVSDEAVNTGLKPYIYYSCRYKGEGSDKRDFIVNFTLDNAITIYGMLPRDSSNPNVSDCTYQTLSGYLINQEEFGLNLTYNNDDIRMWHIFYKDDSYSYMPRPGEPPAINYLIGPEILTEHLLFSTDSNGDGEYDSGDYEYVIYNGQKVYYDRELRDEDMKANSTKYFYYQNYGKSYITNSNVSYANKELLDYLKFRTIENNSDNAILNFEGLSGGYHLYSTSSFEYYKKAMEFSEKIGKLTKGITQKNAVDTNGTRITFDTDTGDAEIFVTGPNNNPLLSKSVFDENRMQVIRESIKSNLTTAIANYNRYSSNYYEYGFPELSETDWEKITNNVSVISFLQGLPIGAKFYNNYCVITNNNNEEVVTKNNVYIITKNKITGIREYHLPGCKHMFEELCNNNVIIENMYSSLSFIRQTVRISEGNYLYFYPQMRKDSNITSCYYCMVNASDVYSTDEIIEGKLMGKDDNWNDVIELELKNGRSKEKDELFKLRNKYLKALGRSRYDLYQANMSSFNT